MSKYSNGDAVRKSIIELDPSDLADVLSLCLWDLSLPPSQEEAFQMLSFIKGRDDVDSCGEAIAVMEDYIRTY